MKKILIAIGIVAVLAIGSSIYVSKNKLNDKADSAAVGLVPVVDAINSTSTVTAIIQPTETSLAITPSTVLQGEPIMIQIDNFNSTATPAIYFAGKILPTFIYDSKPTAFVGVDLNKAAGKYVVSVKLSGSTTTLLTGSVIVKTRPKVSAPLGIPDKLGGNATSSQIALVNNLTKENAEIKSLTTTKTSLWNLPFKYPLKNNVVTDSFGYTRITGAYSISHLGTDFKASEGTNVYAMNNGIVSFARKTTIYGNMVVIDHGLGLQTLYAHLSKLDVTEGQTVARGQIIGLSGQTGYAEQPHLHVSVKISGISVDPIKFLNFFK